ncbi:MAG: hypothetical protein R3F43_03325 [bacterium]
MDKADRGTCEVWIQAAFPGDAGGLASMIAPLIDQDADELESALLAGPVQAGRDLSADEASQLAEILEGFGAQAEVRAGGSAAQVPTSNPAAPPGAHLRSTQPFDAGALRATLEARGIDLGGVLRGRPPARSRATWRERQSRPPGGGHPPRRARAELAMQAPIIDKALLPLPEPPQRRPPARCPAARSTPPVPRRRPWPPPRPASPRPVATPPAPHRAASTPSPPAPRGRHFRARPRSCPPSARRTFVDAPPHPPGRSRPLSRPRSTLDEELLRAAIAGEAKRGRRPGGGAALPPRPRPPGYAPAAPAPPPVTGPAPLSRDRPPACPPCPPCPPIWPPPARRPRRDRRPSLRGEVGLPRAACRQPR